MSSSKGVAGPKVFGSPTAGCQTDDSLGFAWTLGMRRVIQRLTTLAICPDRRLCKGGGISLSASVFSLIVDDADRAKFIVDPSGYSVHDGGAPSRRANSNTVAEMHVKIERLA